MSTDRSRLRLLAPVAGAALLLLLALFAAWFMWPKLAESERSEPNDDSILDMGEGGHPLFVDLVRGHWKVGDSVEAVDARYKDSKTFRIVGFTHGDFTTYRSGLLPRGHFEVVAVRGKLRGAGSAWSLPKRGNRFDTVYFDTLTKEEWAAHDESYRRAVDALHAKGP